jgi:hypothetical protein
MSTGGSAQVHFMIGGKAPTSAIVAYVASTNSPSGSSRRIVLSHAARLPYRTARFVDPAVTRYTIEAASRGKDWVSTSCAVQIGAYRDSGFSGPSTLCRATLLWSARLGHWVVGRPAQHHGPPPAQYDLSRQPLARAFVNPGGVMTGGGAPVFIVGRGTGVKFIPSAPFQVGLSFTDRASRPLTVTGVRAVFPHRSVFQQLGTALSARQPGFGGCGISKPLIFGVLHAKPLRVAPGKEACIQLNFRLLGCPAALHASLQDVRLVDVTYRTGAGTIIHQRVGLRDAHLKIVPTVRHTLVGDRWTRRVLQPCTH